MKKYWKQIGSLLPLSGGVIELRGERQAEPDIVVVVVRVVVVAISRTTILGIVVPAAATNHAVRTFQPISNLHNTARRNAAECACCVKAINGFTCFAYCV